MASDAHFVQFVLDQLDGVPGMSSRKMFGEYALYSGAKVVALICNNHLYVKPTEAGRRFIGTPTEAPAYPGAKPSFLVADGIDDATWLGKLVRITTEELPEPEPKPKARGPSRSP